jgi:heat shock protein HtpX
MKRIILFLITNLAVLITLSISMRLLGIEGILNESYGLDLRALLVYAAVIGFAGSFISLAMSKWSAKMLTGAQVIERPSNNTEVWLVETVRRQAQRAGIGMPEVAIYDSPDMNAFATGMNRNNAMVAVSTGLLYHMRPDEVEAVLGHEVSHVANGDMVTMALIQGVVNTFVIFISRVVGYVVDRTVFRTEEGVGPGYWITSIVAELLLGILATLVVMWFSRQREFRADAGSARLAGKNKMINALMRLQQGYDQSQLPDRLAAFGISGRRGHGSIAGLFLSHPPIEDRIAALRALP